MAIFKSLVPLVKPYETPIDITVHLFESLFILVFHFGVQIPIIHAAAWIKSVGEVNFKLPIEILQRWRRQLLSSFTTVSLPKAIRRVSNSKDTPSQIVTLPTPPRSAPSSPTATQTSPAHPSTRPRQPRQPKRKPLQPIVISPTPSPPPPPAPAPVLVFAPSTPVRRMAMGEPAVVKKNGFLDVEREVEVRRSPRKNKGKRKDNATEAQREPEKAMEVEDDSQRVKSKKRVREEEQQLQPRLTKSIAISHTMNRPGMNKRSVKRAEIQPSKSGIKKSVSGLKRGATMSNVSDLHAGKGMEDVEITVREPKHPRLPPSRSVVSLSERNVPFETSLPKFIDKALPLQQPTSVPIAATRTREPQTLTFSTSTRRMQKSAPNGVAEPEKPLISAAGRARAAKAKAKALTREEEDRKGAGEKRKAAGGGQREGAGKKARVM